MTRTIKSILNALSIKDIKTLIRKHNTHYFIRVKQSKADLIEALAKLYVLHKVGKDVFLKLKDEYNIEVIQKKPLRQRKIKPAQIVPVQQQIVRADIIPQITVPIEPPIVEEIHEPEINNEQYIKTITKNIIDGKLVLPTIDFLKKHNFTYKQMRELIWKLEMANIELKIHLNSQPDLVIRNEHIEKIKKLNEAIKKYLDYKVLLGFKIGTIYPYSGRNYLFKKFPEDQPGELEQDRKNYYDDAIDAAKHYMNIISVNYRTKPKKKISFAEDQARQLFARILKSEKPLNLDNMKIISPEDYKDLNEIQNLKYLIKDFEQRKYSKN